MQNGGRPMPTLLRSLLKIPPGRRGSICSRRAAGSLKSRARARARSRACEWFAFLFLALVRNEKEHASEPSPGLDYALSLELASQIAQPDDEPRLFAGGSVRLPADLKFTAREPADRDATRNPRQPARDVE